MKNCLTLPRHWRTVAMAVLLLLVLCQHHLVKCQGTQAADKTAGEPTAPPAGARAHWTFDATDIDGTRVIDAAGGGHDGKILRGTLVSGVAGQGFELDGAAGGVTVEGLDISGKQQSISLWIRKTEGGVRRLIFINSGFQIGFASEQIFVHTGRIGRADTNLPMATLAIPKREWTHLAITWDTAAAAHHVNVYVNGELQANAHLDTAKGRDLEINTLHIGHSGMDDQVDQHFVGDIDEVAVYDRVLAPGEIASYHKRMRAVAGSTPPSVSRRPIVSQESLEQREPYYPKTPYTGRKKLLRVASELVSRLLDSKSIAAADLPALIEKWQETGLDGLVFNISSSRRDNIDQWWNMCGQWWALIPRTYEELEPDIRAFQSVKDWGRLTDNFLWSSYAVWKDGESKLEVQNWFNADHWEIILANVRLQARVARECGFKGVLFDTEQYEGHHAEGAWHIPFSYPNYREDGYLEEGLSKPRSFEDVAAKIRQRGTQYAQALCAGYPGLKILMIGGLYEFVYEFGGPPLEDNHTGLSPSFIDGMLLGMDEEATLIGGSELTYGKTRYVDIGDQRRKFDKAIDDLSSVSDRLKKKMSFAAGIWVDTDRTWSDTDVSQNVRNPQDHERAVRNAFIASDEYAWIYGEQSRFLIGEPTPLMKQYFKANEDAHELKKDELPR